MRRRWPASRRVPRSVWRKRDAEEARQFIQAALGWLRRGDEDARGRDVERPGLPVRRRLSRGIPPLHGGAEPDQLLRRQDRRGITAETRKIAARMEAERLNQLASSLSDLEKRSAELRRYL